MALTATPGQRGETPELKNLLSSVPMKLHHKQKRPKPIAGDKAYSAKSTRNDLNIQGIKAVLPKRKNEKRNKFFSRKLYKRKNIIHRVIGWLKESRRIATRFDKNIDCYLAMIYIAMIRMILKS